jgi:hypothetical protein
MPRSPSGENFEVSSSDAPRPGGEGRASAFEELGPAQASSAKIQYGKSHAETARRYARKRAEREETGPGATAAKAAPVTAELPEAAPVKLGTPIGALPFLEEPPLPQAEATAWDQARRNVGLITHSLRDVSEALGRLGRLSADAMRRARQGMRTA